MLKTRNGEIIGTRRPLPHQFLRLRAVSAMTGLCRSSIYEKVQQGEFPKPVQLGPKSIAWLESEVAEWQAKLIAQRDGGAA